jgi:hypothetical protein
MDRVHADAIKSVHQRLREKAKGSKDKDESSDVDREGAAMAVWRAHTEDGATLKSYSLSMEALANEHWDKKTEEESRIGWIEKTAKRFFVEGDCNRIREEEEGGNLNMNSDKTLDVSSSRHGGDSPNAS